MEDPRTTKAPAEAEARANPDEAKNGSDAGSGHADEPREVGTGRRKPKPWRNPARATTRMQHALIADERFKDKSARGFPQALILTALSEWTPNQDGEFFVEHKTIRAAMGEVSSEAIRRAWVAWERLGVIERVLWRHDQTGRRVANTYRLDPALVLEPTRPAHPSDSGDGQVGAKSAPGTSKGKAPEAVEPSLRSEGTYIGEIGTNEDRWVGPGGPTALDDLSEAHPEAPGEEVSAGSSRDELTRTDQLARLRGLRAQAGWLPEEAR